VRQLLPALVLVLVWAQQPLAPAHLLPRIWLPRRSGVAPMHPASHPHPGRPVPCARCVRACGASAVSFAADCQRPLLLARQWNLLLLLLPPQLLLPLLTL
jgi:hypothetical protein